MESLVNLLRAEGIVVRGNVALRGKDESNVYFDVKKAYGNPRLLKIIAKATLDILDPKTSCVAAKGYGGIPLATAVSLEGQIPLATVRDGAQKHGLRKWIEGYIPCKEDHVTLIDDVFTTGGSLREVAEVVERYGAKIHRGIVVIKRGEVKMLFPVNCLVDYRELL